MNFDLWRLIDSQHLIVMEIALLDRAILDGDLARQYGSKREIDRPFGHRPYSVRVHSDATVDDAHHAVDLDRAIILHGDFGNLGAAGLTGAAGDAPALALGQRLSPIRPFRRQLQYGSKSHGLRGLVRQ